MLIVMEVGVASCNMTHFIAKIKKKTLKRVKRNLLLWLGLRVGRSSSQRGLIEQEKKQINKETELWESFESPLPAAADSSATRRGTSQPLL